jgi:hypothetical protein
LLAACTISWKGINDKAGNPVPCNNGNARALYEQAPEVRDQVDRFINDRASFLQNSATS